MKLTTRIQQLADTTLGIAISRSATEPRTVWEYLLKARDKGFAYLSDEEADFVAFCARHLQASRAQLFQDLFALFMSGEKRSGFFVEFGATNGVELSNTYLLEKSYGWTGILAEPARGWHGALRTNRTCSIDTRCVTDRTGETVMFNETADKVFSTIDTYSSSDGHSEARATGERYPVETISLNDLLTEHKAPSSIDYLSVDTEGSEYTILSALDFDRFQPKLITVEHNDVPGPRDGIYKLLSSKGYVRKFTELSRWDDWYVLS